MNLGAVGPITARMLDQLSERVWTDTRGLPNMPIQRVSTIVRRADGTLLVHSPNAGTEDAIAALGEVSYLVVPNRYHRLDIARFAKRFPSAKVVCPRGAADKVGEVVKVDAAYEDVPDDGHVSLRTFRGTKEGEGVVIVKDDAGTTLVVNDVLFNMPHVGGFKGFVLKHVTASSGGPKTSRLAKWFIVKDRAAFASELRALAKTPDLKRVVVAHHVPIEDDAAGTLARVADAL